MRHVYVHLVAESIEQFVYMDCFAFVLLNFHPRMTVFSFLAGQYVSIIEMPCDLLKTERSSVTGASSAACYPTHNICPRSGHLGQTAGPSPRGAHLMFR